MFQGITKTPTTLKDHMSSAGKVTGKTAEESKSQFAILTPEQDQGKTIGTGESPINADLAKEVEEIKKEHLI